MPHEHKRRVKFLERFVPFADGREYDEAVRQYATSVRFVSTPISAYNLSSCALGNSLPEVVCPVWAIFALCRSRYF